MFKNNKRSFTQMMNHNLRETVTELEKSIVIFKDYSNELKEKNNDLLSKISKSMGENKDLKKKYDQLIIENKEMENKITWQQSLIKNKMESKLDSINVKRDRQKKIEDDLKKREDRLRNQQIELDQKKIDITRDLAELERLKKKELEEIEALKKQTNLLLQKERTRLEKEHKKIQNEISSTPLIKSISINQKKNSPKNKLEIPSMPSTESIVNKIINQKTIAPISPTLPILPRDKLEESSLTLINQKKNTSVSPKDKFTFDLPSVYTEDSIDMLDGLDTNGTMW